MDEMNHKHMGYSAPTVRSLGSVEDMTRQQLHKIGSASDLYTPTIPHLDGTIFHHDP